jgi:hypothetical protein
MYSQFKLSPAFRKSPELHDFKWKRFSGILSTQLFLMLVMLVIVLGCGGVDSDDLKFQKSQTVSGLVLKIEAKSLLELESLTVLDDLGTEWVFEIEHPHPLGFTPSHIREHMLLGKPITVTFHFQGGNLIADYLND